MKQIFLPDDPSARRTTAQLIEAAATEEDPVVAGLLALTAQGFATKISENELTAQSDKLHKEVIRESEESK